MFGTTVGVCGNGFPGLSKASPKHVAGKAVGVAGGRDRTGPLFCSGDGRDVASVPVIL